MVVGVGQAQRVTALASLLRAPNPSLMTLSGTNTWVLRQPGVRRCVLVDPGPLDRGHLAAIDQLGDVGLVLLTHGHPDHSEAVDAVHASTGAPVRAADRTWCRDAPPLTDAEVIESWGVRVQVVTTPGHTSDSVCLRLPDDSPAAELTAGSVLTGDTVLGEGTAVVAHPDGRLDAYLASLRLLSRMVGVTVLPGHGPTLPDAAAVALAYLAHREQRLDQVRDALAAGASTPRDVVRLVYADVDEALWPAAELSVRAQLEYLREHPGPSADPVRGGDSW